MILVEEMRAKHGLKFISKIPTDFVPILHESWVEYANQKQPGENDRAKNVRYSIFGMGVTLSHSSGTMTIDTNEDEKCVSQLIQRWLSKGAYELFVKNLVCDEVGAHFRKFHGTVGFILDIKKPGKIPIWISVRGCTNYADVHIKVPWRMAGIEKLSKNSYTSTSSPKRKYTSDIDIMKFVEEKGVVRPKDGNELNLSESQFYRRLEKLKDMKKLTKTSNYPALYTINK